MIKIKINDDWIDFYPIYLKKTKYYYYNSIKIKQYQIFKFNCEDCGTLCEKSMKLSLLEFICRKCKTKKTSQQKYGTDSPNQSKQVIEKKITSNTYFNSSEFKKQAKQTKLIKYGNENFNNREKSKQTKRKKYGNEKYQNVEKYKQTNLKKYGVENISQIEEIKNKKIQTNLKKYGVEHYPQLTENKKALSEKKLNISKEEKAIINDKRKKTCQEKYGVDHIAKVKDISIKKNNTTLLLRYSSLINRLSGYVAPLFTEKEYKTNHYTNKYKWKCLVCNNEFEDDVYAGKIPICPKCHEISKEENNLFNWINSLTICNKHNRTIISPYELDIYIPDHNLAIEFDGLYWHSELNGKNKNYHLNKTNLCLEKGIHLFHIFEDEWIEKQEIIKSIIKSRLGLFDQIIYGRKCEVKKIDSKKANEFYEVNHIQGSIASSVNLGLFYQNELVSCLSFANPRFNKNYDWEITRFANKLNTKIIGSFAKLLNQSPKGKIITYSDKRLFTGEIYKNNGFKQLFDSNPNYYYIKGQRRFSRIQFQKHKLKNKLKIFNSNLTEWENMQLNGWNRIWDCGNYVFELIR